MYVYRKVLGYWRCLVNHDILFFLDQILLSSDYMYVGVCKWFMATTRGAKRAKKVGCLHCTIGGASGPSVSRVERVESEHGWTGSHTFKPLRYDDNIRTSLLIGQAAARRRLAIVEIILSFFLVSLAFS